MATIVGWVSQFASVIAAVGAVPDEDVPPDPDEDSPPEPGEGAPAGGDDDVPPAVTALFEEEPSDDEPEEQPTTTIKLPTVSPMTFQYLISPISVGTRGCECTADAMCGGR
jgi:hypothetical protein